MPQYFSWLDAKQDAMAPQLVKIGASLTPAFGITAADVTYWQAGAAMNSWLQSQLIPAIRDFSTAVTAARDEFQFDKTVGNFPIPTFNLPAPPVAPTGMAPLKTDFLDWCDGIYKRMRLNGLSDSGAKSLGFVVTAPPAPIPQTDMKPRIVSIDTQPGGEVVVTASRDGQKMIHVEITLDTGVVMEKTLPNTKFSFVAPTDRVHGLEARARYADKDGNDFGQWSDSRTDSSEV